MPKITLEEAKLHLRVDAGDEDGLITTWIAAAYLAIEGKIFRKVVDAASADPETKDVVADHAINAVALLIVGHLYANREAVAIGQPVELPLGAEWLLVPYRDYSEGV